MDKLHNRYWGMKMAVTGQTTKQYNDMQKFKKELEQLINKHSIENYADMPDFMMAEMICGFIVGVGSHIKGNLDWHECDSICHPKKESICDTAPYPQCNGAEGCDTCEEGYDGKE